MSISQKLENCYKNQIEIELVYYPPYHSKYNPIERLWARLEMMWNGTLLKTQEICNQIMSALTWKKVKAKVKFITKEYEKGVTYSKTEMEAYEGVNILRNQELKKWSVSITPNSIKLCLLFLEIAYICSLINKYYIMKSWVREIRTPSSERGIYGNIYVYSINLFTKHN